ncbi:hypothetical protein RIF29_38866 [Crotalaria pallida]|uniref:Cytochrome P450 n=1 Tax=Crotalaria pallida TaxID=3830 RepID=A0AAN9E063_CROPI
MEARMEAEWTATKVVTVILVVIWGWRMLNRLWLKPKKQEKLLREQGLKGNPYRFLIGDLKEILKSRKETESKPMALSDDIVPHVSSYLHQSVNKHGKNFFIWFGPIPRVTINDPELIKDVFNKIDIFPKPALNPLVELLVTGLTTYEGEKWSKHRRIINPAFNLEKIKVMLPIFFISCNDLINEWEGMLSSDGTCEMDVWPFLQNLACDIISRTAFGSSYEEGKRIFNLQKEQAEVIMKVIHKSFIPGWR